MKKYCGCNAVWENDYDNVLEIPVEMFEGMGEFDPEYDFSCEARVEDYCEICTFYCWYRANEENMMFDLKNMNQM